MPIINYDQKFLPELTKIYNEFKIKDSDFRPLSIDEFKAKFIDLPYKGKIVRKIYIDEDERIKGFIVADYDKSVEEKFGKKIAIIDILVAEPKNFSLIASELIKYAKKDFEKYNVKEIQAHFIDEKNSEEYNFFKKDFDSERKWFYMECKVFRFPKDLIELSEGLRWEKLIFKGKKSNVKKWIECYNEAFREHFGMRPLSYKELMSYTLEKSFDAEAYFGIFDEKSKAFIAECSCEIDEGLNKFKNISRCVIWTVGVRKAYRGKGFGKKLVYKALDYMLKRNIETAAIHVDEKNEIAYNLYRSIGFETKRYRSFFIKEI